MRKRCRSGMRRTRKRRWRRRRKMRRKERAEEKYEEAPWPLGLVLRAGGLGALGGILEATWSHIGIYYATFGSHTKLPRTLV